MLPGLVSIAFYRRRPTGLQVAAGIAVTVVVSGFLGAIFPTGPLTRLGSIILAIVGGVALYVAILAYLVYVYQPMKAQRAAAPASGPP
jgi:hypothetical protein